MGSEDVLRNSATLGTGNPLQMVFFFVRQCEKKILLMENVIMKLIALYNEYILVKAF